MGQGRKPTPEGLLLHEAASPTQPNPPFPKAHALTYICQPLPPTRPPAVHRVAHVVPVPAVPGLEARARAHSLGCRALQTACSTSRRRGCRQQWGCCGALSARVWWSWHEAGDGAWGGTDL